MKHSRFFIAAVIGLSSTFATSAVTAAPAKYTVDKDHSKIGFAVRHMMISDVEGNFKDFDGSFTFDADKDVVTEGKFSVQTASITTGNAKRDEHLQSADFFDAAKFPTITFKDTTIKKTSKDHYKWSGQLTMHGETHPLTFDLEHTATIKDPYGNMRAGFSANGTLKRSEWGLKWNKPLEASAGVAVSDEVRMKLNVEAVQAKDADASSAPKKSKN